MSKKGYVIENNEIIEVTFVGEIPDGSIAYHFVSSLGISKVGFVSESKFFKTPSDAAPVLVEHLRSSVSLFERGLEIYRKNIAELNKKISNLQVEPRLSVNS